MFTITTQGSFVSDGLSRVIQVPQGIDWFKAVNMTNIAGAVALAGYEFEWYRGMAVNDGILEGTIIAGPVWGMSTSRVYAAAGGVVGGFTLIDSTTQLPARQGTTVSNTAAAAPVVTTTAVGAGQAGTNNMVTDRTVVRMNYANVVGASPSLMGIDYTVTVNTATTFTLPTHANAIPNGGAGVFTIVSYSSDPLFYPVNRTVINITQAVNPTVTTSVIHNLTVGQEIRLKVPAVCGMTQINDKTATVLTVVNPYSFTITGAQGDSVDSTGFTAFVWPLVASYPYQVAECIPVGQACSVPASQSFAGGTVNQGYTGMVLAAGTNAASLLVSPAGTTADVIYWQAGKVANL
jgi:hypothetical protein